MELDSGFKDRVRWAINIKESNQSELARHLGVSAQAIQQWVAGATLSPRREHVQAASEFLGCRYEWLAYGRGPMRTVEDDAPAGQHNKHAVASEGAILAHEWEAALLAALPNAQRESWQPRIAHPSGQSSMRVDWVTDQIVAEVGLYRHVGGTMIASIRQRLWLLVLARELLPPVPGRRTLLLLAPLEDWVQKSDKYIDALRAEARVLNIEVQAVTTPEHAAAVLLGKEEAPTIPAGEDHWLDASPVLQ